MRQGKSWEYLNELLQEDPELAEPHLGVDWSNDQARVEGHIAHNHFFASPDCLPAIHPYKNINPKENGQ